MHTGGHLVHLCPMALHHEDFDRLQMESAKVRLFEKFLVHRLLQ